MNYMKKLLIGFLILMILIVPIFALANVPGAPRITPEDVVTQVINIIWYVIVTAVVVMIMIAAATFLMAAGNADNIKKAQNYMLYAVIALVLGFAARGIAELLTRQFRGQ